MTDANLPMRPRCPICKKPAASPNEDCFPFCSDRCRLIDLGRWMDGSYMTSRPIDPTDEQDPDRK